ncbi:MAG: type II CRISPR RNA-guided endonuclease Cas9 [Blastochloris sp.]|nr:type II CRISPR RNA-guided endonuclease Cas9 [Blastochloris sp.]
MNSTLYLVGSDAPLTKLSKTFPLTINENLSLGLDIGVGSCGQALIKWDRTDSSPVGKLAEFPNLDSTAATNFSGPIAFLGVRAFDVPERYEKTGIKLKNPERRQARLMRRTIQRRAKRMHKIRMLLKQHGIVPSDYSLENEAWQKKHVSATPLQWRVDALDRLLDPWEFAAVLLHLAKHRGFKSNRKSDLVSDSKGKEGGTLESTRANHERLKNYRSVGEMWLNDPLFQDRKRNREGSYTATMLREDLQKEIKLIFSKQRELGMADATPNLETAFIKIFSQQNPLQDPIMLLGDCPFEPNEKRGAQRAYSFELSRALQKLNTIHLRSPTGLKVLLSVHVQAANGGYAHFITQFGSKKSISWSDLRKIFELDEAIQFLDLPSAKRKNTKIQDSATTLIRPEQIRQELEKEDFATRSGKNSTAFGSHILFKALGSDLWNELTTTDPASLDNVAFCLTFYEALESHPPQTGIYEAMIARGVDQRVIDLLQMHVNEGTFTIKDFTGSVALSTKASRVMVPRLARGLFYTDAAKEAGYEPLEQDFSLAKIVNPVVQSVVREVIKQVAHLIDEAGSLPGTICIEMARDIGKSIDERNEISKALEKRTTQKNANRESFASYLSPGHRITDDDLERYELWLDQGGWCSYSDQKLPSPEEILSDQVEVDHILPRSRSHDNSYDNKVLVYKNANQNKRQKTPFEWMGSDENSEAWRQFVARVNNFRIRKRKRQYLLNTDFAEKEAEFIARNLQDTRYICRLVRAYLEDFYRLAGEQPGKPNSTRRVFVQPGGLTSLVRKAWGLEDLKKDILGNRLGDKHHAVDALVCAGLSEGQRQWLTRHEQGRVTKEKIAYNAVDQLGKSYILMEQEGRSNRTPRGLSTPWGTAAVFRSDVVRALDTMTVSRRERRHGRGSWHNDTFYREVLKPNGQKTYYKRTSLVNLVNNKPQANAFNLDDVKDIHLHTNAWLKEALLIWFQRGKPVDEDQLPRGHKPKENGDLADLNSPVIRKVWVDQGNKSARKTDHGMVVGGHQVRVDVFAKTTKKGATKYFLVPVYAHDIRYGEPPMLAIIAHKPEATWDIIDNTYEFRFSLWPNSLIFSQRKGIIDIGYYSGVDRSTGSLSFSSLNDKVVGDRTSVKQGCLAFKKYTIDRLGRVSEIKSEKRTWRGGVCI